MKFKNTEIIHKFRRLFNDTDHNKRIYFYLYKVPIIHPYDRMNKQTTLWYINDVILYNNIIFITIKTWDLWWYNFKDKY